MHLEATQRFIRDYRALPPVIQDLAQKALRLLERSPAHPSLHHRKMAGHGDIYEVRVSIHYRITYQRVGDQGYLRRIGPHDVLRRP